MTAGVYRTHGGDWTGPFLVGDRFGSAAEWPIPIRMLEQSVGYDGQFYLALAFDPLLRTPLAGVFDDAEYRAHRITWSLAAWLLGAGDDSMRVAFLYLLMLAGAVAMGSLFADWAVRRGASAWWGFAGALGLGSLVCLQRMLGDVIMVSLLVATAVAVARGSRRGEVVAVVSFTLAVLQKETAALAFPLLALPLLQRRRAAALPWLAVPVLAVAGWWWFVDSAIAVDGPFSLAIPFGAPGAGFATALGEALGRAPDLLRLGKDVAFFGLHAVAVGLGLWIGWTQVTRSIRGRVPEGLPLAIGLFALLGVFLSENVWVEPWAYARVLLPLLSLELLLGLEELRRSKSSLVAVLATGLALASCVMGLLFVSRNLYATAL